MRRFMAASVPSTSCASIVVAAYGVSQLLSAQASHERVHYGAVMRPSQLGAVSQAQEHGCETHVTAAQVDSYANHGDQTAIAAEKQESAFEDAENGN